MTGARGLWRWRCWQVALLAAAAAAAGAVRAHPRQARTEPAAPLYARLCASCHGPAMQGGDGGPALLGPRFARKWAGKSRQQLVEKIRITMPQDDPGTLPRDDAETLAAAILAKAGLAPEPSSDRR